MTAIKPIAQICGSVAFGTVHFKLQTLSDFFGVGLSSRDAYGALTDVRMSVEFARELNSLKFPLRTEKHSIHLRPSDFRSRSREMSFFSMILNHCAIFTPRFDSRHTSPGRSHWEPLNTVTSSRSLQPLADASSILDRLCAACLGMRHSTLIVSVVCFLLCYCVAFTKIQYVTHTLGIPAPKHVAHKYPYESTPYYWGGWNYLMEKVRSPFEPSTAPPETHEAKNAFRLAPPLVANVLSLTPGGVIAILLILGWQFFYLLLKRAPEVFGDRQLCFWTAVGFVSIYTGYSGPLAFSGKMDSFAYFFMLAAMLCTRGTSIFVTMQMACWTDERAVIASGLIYLWWRVRNCGKPPSSLKDLLPMDIQSLSVTFALAAYVIGRVLLQQFTSLSTPTGGLGFGVLLKLSEFWWVGTWSFFRGMWLPVVVALWVLLRRKNLLCAAVLAASIGASTLVAFCVYDITRSGSFGFPAVLIGILILTQTCEMHEIRQLLKVGVLVSFLSGPLYLIAGPGQNSWAFQAFTVSDRPLLIRVVEYVYFYLL